MTSIFYRALMTSDSDTLGWVAAETEIVTNWPDPIGDIQVSSWDGLMSVTFTEGGGTSA